MYPLLDCRIYGDINFVFYLYCDILTYAFGHVLFFSKQFFTSQLQIYPSIYALSYWEECLLYVFLHSEHGVVLLVEGAGGILQDEGAPRWLLAAHSSGICGHENILRCSTPDRKSLSKLRAQVWPSDNLSTVLSTLHLSCPHRCADSRLAQQCLILPLALYFCTLPPRSTNKIRLCATCAEHGCFLLVQSL